MIMVQITRMSKSNTSTKMNMTNIRLGNLTRAIVYLCSYLQLRELRIA
jgi:hypothetical protein